MKIRRFRIIYAACLKGLFSVRYINDLKNTSTALDLIVFADDTNLFISDKNVNTLFTKANLELQKMNEWFTANKLSRNTYIQKKMVFSLYHKIAQKDNVPLALPILRIDSVELKRKASMKFLGVLLEKSLTWKDHINTIEK